MESQAATVSPEPERSTPETADKKAARPINPPIVRDRPVDEVAAKLAKERLLPRPPGKKLTFEEMQKYFSLLTPEMWHHIVIYLYRDYPRIIRKLKNPENPKYIDVLAQPFDLEYMIEHHGGGRYSVMVCDTEAKIHSEANRLFECDFEINTSKYEPKLNYEELDINHKGNMAYVQLLQHRGILDSKGQVMSAQANPLGSSPDVVKAILDFASKMSADKQEELRARISPEEQSISKSLGDLLLQKIAQDDPTKQAASLLAVVKEMIAINKPAEGSNQALEMLAIVKEVVALNKPADNGAFEKIIQMQGEHNRAMLSMYEKLIEANRKPEPPENPILDQMDKVLAVVERVAGFRSGGGNRNGWEIGLDYAKEFGVPALSMLTNLFALNRTGRPMPPVSTPGAAGGAAFDPYANPAAMRALANSMAQPGAPANGAAQMPPANELQATIRMYGGLLVNHLNMGTPGHQFADLVTGLLGNGTHAQICAQGEPALLQALLSTPEIAVFGEPRLKTFVHEFVNFQEFLDAESDEEDEDAEPVGAAVDGSGHRAARGAHYERA